MGAPPLTLYAGKEGNAEGRSYKRPGTGLGKDNPAVTLPSITTILKQADKSGLVQWAVGLTLDAVNANPDMVYQRSDQDMKRHFQYAWTRVRDERAQVGTGIHETVEAIHEGTENFPFLDDEQMRIMQQFDEFNFYHRVEPILSEFTVWDEDEWQYAGTADGEWLIDGVEWLIDIKTSKNTWPEHFAQLAALRFAPAAWVQCEEGKPGAQLHIDPKKRETWWRKIGNPALNAEKVGILHLREDKWELIEVTDLDLHYKIFTGYAQVHHAKAELKTIAKAATLADEQQEV